MDVCRHAAGENTSCALTEELPAVDLLLYVRPLLFVHLDRQKKASIRSSPSLKMVVFRQICCFCKRSGWNVSQIC